MNKHEIEDEVPLKPDLIDGLSSSELEALRADSLQLKKKLDQIAISNFNAEQNNKHSSSDNSYGKNLLDLASFKAHVQNRSKLLNKSIDEVFSADEEKNNNQNSIDSITDEKLSPMQREKKDELLDDYLGLLINTYDDDLDKLRSSHDFNSNTSLILLANLLKTSGNIFSVDNLDMILNKN